MRRPVGEWLRTQAKPGATVFTESLGYIGFDSGLKTFDFPGMSSREMVDQTRKYRSDWNVIISNLAPDWVVLRPQEFARVPVVTGEFQPLRYQRVATFDNREAIQATSVPGRAYLEHDSVFHVFRLLGREEKAPLHERVIQGQLLPRELQQLFQFFHPLPLRSFSTFTYSLVDIDAHRFFSVHPTTQRWFAPPAPRCVVQTEHLINPGAYEGRKPGDTTNGIDFALHEIRRDGSRRTRFQRLLDPVANAADRGIQKLRMEITVAADSELLFETTPGPDGNWAYDWAMVGPFSIEPQQAPAP